MGTASATYPQRDKTLRKGLHLLELLTLQGALSLRDVIAQSGLKKGNAYHLLQTLIEEGYVQQGDSARYAPTLKLWEIGMLQSERLDFVPPCLPAMLFLRNETRETVNLAMLDGHEVLYLHKLDSLEAVRTFTRVGGRAPAHCVATGKAILAFDRKGEDLWRALPKEQFSNTTITDPARFAEEMIQTRTRGYSINQGEWHGAVRGIAAPIFGWGNRVRLALGIAAPGERLPPARTEVVGALVVSAAQQASEAISGLKAAAPSDLA